MSDRPRLGERDFARAIPSVHERQNRIEAHNANALTAVAIEDFGEGFTGSCCAAHPYAESLNALTGWAPGDFTRLDHALDWVRAIGGGAHVRVEGAETNVDMHVALAGRGFQITEVEVWLWARTDDVASQSLAADIRPAQSPEERRLWAETATDGWGVDESFRPVWHEALAPNPPPTNWNHLIAYCDDAPAATSLLTMEEHKGVSIGYLADASVTTAHRGRGLQRELITARAKLAAEKGAEVLFAGARWGSASHRNMERSGLSVAEVCTLWRLASAPTP